MAKTMKIIAVCSVLATVVFGIIGINCDGGIFETLAITSSTIAYHFCMRLLVGAIVNAIMKNRADYSKPWFRLHKWEKKWYDILKVKAWKNRMPTYDPDLFSPGKHTWDEIAQAMCQSEIVHEINGVLSFLPVLLTLCFGEFAVFLLTSLGGAVYDFMFVIMQRYNRPRVIKMVQKSMKIKENKYE